MPALRKLNPKLAIGGAWFDLTANSFVAVPEPVADHICLLVARADNPKFRAALSRACAPHAKAMRKGGLPPELWEEINLRALAEGVLVGWAGIDDDNGKPVAYSPEQAFAYLSDQALYELRQFVQDAAGFSRAYQQEQEAEQQGN